MDHSWIDNSNRPWLENSDGVLIVGSPRSGTSLLAGMLAVHSEIAMAFEDFDLGCKGVIGKQVWGNKLTIPNQIRLDPKGSQRGLRERLSDAVRALFGRPRLFGPWGYGDDPPYYEPPEHRQITIATYVENLGAHLVAVVRDPDHAIESMQKRRGTSSEEAKRRYACAVRDINEARKRYDSVSIVKFRDLVEQTEGTMRALSERIGVGFEGAMLEGFKAVPQYDFNKIDPSVATKEVPMSNFEHYDPEAREMYEELLEISLDRAEK